MGVEGLKQLRGELEALCDDAAQRKGGTLNGVRETVKQLERRIDELIEEHRTPEWLPEAGTSQRIMKIALERIAEADTSTAGVLGTYAEDVLTALSVAKQRVPTGYTDWRTQVHTAYRCLREHNSTIPDEVLETMKVILLSHEGPFTGLREEPVRGGTKSITAEKLYRCVACGAHYQTKVSSCDCSDDNGPFEYTRAYAVSHEAIEQLLAAHRVGASRGVERGLLNILNAEEG